MLDASPRHRDENKFFLREKSIEAHHQQLADIKNRRSQFRPIKNRKFRLCKSPSCKAGQKEENYKLSLENEGITKRLLDINGRNNKFICDQKEVNSLLSRRKHQYELLRNMEKKRLETENAAYKNRIVNTNGCVVSQKCEKKRGKVKLKKIQRKKSPKNKTTNEPAEDSKNPDEQETEIKAETEAV